jgi:hypothetical protein
MKLNFKELKKIYNRTPDSAVQRFIELEGDDRNKLFYVIVKKFNIATWDKFQEEANELLPGNEFEIDYYKSSRGELVRFLDKVLSIIKSNSKVLSNE